MLPPHEPGTYAAWLASGHFEYADEAAFVRADGNPISYAETTRIAASVIAALQELGLWPGDRVVLALPNDVRALLVERAVMLWGAVRVAVAARLHPLEVAHIAHDCDARVAVVDDAHADQLAGSTAGPAVVAPDPSRSTGPGLDDLLAGPPTPHPWPGAHPGATASLMYTSGTTGRPKGAINAQRSWAAMARGAASCLPGVGTDDVLVHAAPFTHFSGSVAAAYAVHGAAIGVVARFRPDTVLADVEHLGGTCVPLVPTMLNDVTTHLERTGTSPPAGLRVVPYGGSGVSVRAISRARTAFGERLVQFYGASEALIPVATLSSDAHRRIDGHRGLVPVGEPGPEVQLSLRTPNADGIGEIMVAGPQVTDGYWGDPGRTAEVLGADGWLATGDVGRFGPDGLLYIVGRSREVIISGGFNVYPAEVERVIEQIPDVAEVAVVGVAHPRWGEGVAAVVSPAPGADLTPDRVVDACRSQLAGYKKPVRVDIVSHLPRNSSGKIDKHRLGRELAAHESHPNENPATEP